MRQQRMRPSRLAIMVAVATITVLAFGWPLFVVPGAAVASASSAAVVFVVIVPVVLAITTSDLVRDGVDVNALALLGVLTALGAALRPLGAGTAGVETVFFVIILGGRVLGPRFGFLLGNTTLFASAMLTGGFGPWLPYQMLAAALVGAGAGLLPRARGWVEIAWLSAYGSMAAIGFGVALDLASWPYLSAGTQIGYVPGDPVLANLHRFAILEVATGMGWNVGRALTTTLLLVLLGRPLLPVLRRGVRRAAMVPAGNDETIRTFRT